MAHTRIDPDPTAEPASDVDEPGPGQRVLDLTDDELTAQTLAASSTGAVPEDAVSYWDVVAPRDPGLLPAWYMPSPSAGARQLRGWRRRVVYLVTGSIVVINAAGLCITYGHVTLG